MSAYTENTLVQQTTANYLEQQLGWTSVLAYNHEDFGPSSLLGRASDCEVVLTRTLRAKLIALNPGLPEAAYDDAVRQITATVASQTLVATNREKYAQMRDGMQVTFRNDKGERIRQRLRVFDFDVPENNDFICVREPWVRGDLYGRRADPRLRERPAADHIEYIGPRSVVCVLERFALSDACRLAHGRDALICGRALFERSELARPP